MIISTDEISVVQKEIEDSHSSSLVVLIDIDDTIITPKSNMFRKNSKYRNFIDEIKYDEAKYKHFEEIIINWRMKRKVILVSELWKEIIEKAKESGAKVYALTMMDSGKLGKMEKVEDWRYQELKSLDICFTEHYNKKDDFVLIDSADAKNAKFYRGFFMTGSFSKGEVARNILQPGKHQKVIFIDDRADHVESVEQTCKELDIEYIGIIFDGIAKIPGEPFEHIIEIQKKMLLEQGIWLEDKEVWNMFT